MEIGNWVDADQNTGRIVHIPNGKIFTETLANYGKGFEYIFNEIPVLITFESDWKKAKKNLSKKDKIMARLIKSYESPSETILTSRKDIFYSLCKSIIGQQISVAAANSVFFKF